MNSNACTHTHAHTHARARTHRQTYTHTKAKIYNKQCLSRIHTQANETHTENQHRHKHRHRHRHRHTAHSVHAQPTNTCAEACARACTHAHEHTTSTQRRFCTIRSSRTHSERKRDENPQKSHRHILESAKPRTHPRMHDRSPISLVLTHNI